MYFLGRLLPLRRGSAHRACKEPGNVSTCFRDNRAERKLGSDAQHPMDWRAEASTRTRCTACPRERMDKPAVELLTLRSRDNFLHDTTPSRRRGSAPA